MKKQLKIRINEDKSKLYKLENEVKEQLKSLDNKKINEGKPYKKFRYEPEYYKNLIFNPRSLEELKNVKIELEVIDSRNKNMDIWNFYRYYVSSLKTGRSVGIQMYILVKDKISSKYLGIIQLGSDFNNIAVRDKYIGWDNETRNKNLKYILNIKTCVPLQPFGFNCTGGKLLAMLCFSREISDLFLQKMNNRKENPKNYPILAISTTSLYGKGVQYSKLKCLKYLGLTKGESATHISDELFKKCKILCEMKNIKFGDNKHARGKLIILKKLLPQLNLPRSIIYHENRKGFFLGYLYPNSKDLLINKDIDDSNIIENVNMSFLKSIDEIYQYWLHRFAIRRFSNMKSQKRFKNYINLNITLKDKRNNYQIEYRKKLIEEYGKDACNSENDSEINIEKIKEEGLKKIREYEKKRKENSKSKYQKKKFIDKYDLSKLKSINFDGRNLHLKDKALKIEEIVNSNVYISNRDLAKKLQLSYDSTLSILKHLKF